MIHEIIMPKLGETMEEGYLVGWKKEIGDRVEKGDVLFEVMSDKTNFEVESLYAGFLRAKLVEPSDEAVAVTTVIGTVSDTADEPLPEAGTPAAAKPAAAAPAPAAAQPAPRPAVPQPAADESGRVFASPLARKTARERGIPVERIAGSGPGGRIEKKDVLAYAESAPAPAGPPDTGYDVREWSPMRRIIAERLGRSKATIPHYYIEGTIGMEALAGLKDLSKKDGAGYSYTDLIVFFTARVLREFPLLNAAVAENEIRVHRSVDVGLAVAIEDGLVVPVIRGCDRKSLGAVAAEIRALAGKAREGRLAKADIDGARFIISNLGMYGVENFQPIINPPGTAIMGVGALRRAPVAAGDAVVVKPVMSVSLSLDHRVIDGAYGGRFFQRLKQVMENPGLLLL